LHLYTKEKVFYNEGLFMFHAMPIKRLLIATLFVGGTSVSTHAQYGYGGNYGSGYGGSQNQPSYVADVHLVEPLESTYYTTSDDAPVPMSARVDALVTGCNPNDDVATFSINFVFTVFWEDLGLDPNNTINLRQLIAIPAHDGKSGKADGSGVFRGTMRSMASPGFGSPVFIGGIPVPTLRNYSLPIGHWTVGTAVGTTATRNGIVVNGSANRSGLSSDSKEVWVSGT
jgi:hypothetical protein